jgi:hypothetical protein
MDAVADEALKQTILSVALLLIFERFTIQMLIDRTWTACGRSTFAGTL